MGRPSNGRYPICMGVEGLNSLHDNKATVKSSEHAIQQPISHQRSQAVQCSPAADITISSSMRMPATVC